MCLLASVFAQMSTLPVIETEPWWVSISKQIPAVIAIIFIVMKFLEHIEKSENKRIASEEKRGALQKELTMDVTAASHLVRTSLDKNTEMLGRTGVALERMEDAIESLKQDKPKGT